AFVVDISRAGAPAPEEQEKKQAVKAAPAEKKQQAPAEKKQQAPAEKKKAAPAPASAKKQPAKAPPPAEEKSEAPMKFAEEEEDDGQAYGMGADDVAAYRCPQCAAEMAGPEATVCLECGFNTQTRTSARKRKLKEITG